MKNTQVKSIAQFGIFFSLVLVMALIPNVGFITVGVVGFTTIHAVTIIFILLTKREQILKHSLIYGFLFGLSSWMVAMMRAASVVELLFRNPLVSVLPRTIFGLSVAALFLVLSKIIRNRKVTYGVVALMATALHTFMVIVALSLVGGWAKGLETAFQTIMSVNFVFEAIVAVLLATTAVIPLRKAIR